MKRAMVRMFEQQAQISAMSPVRSRRWIETLIMILRIVAVASLTGFLSVLTVPAGAQNANLTFTVDSIADDLDAKVGDGVCATTAGACTLRAAIAEANKHAGPEIIAFGIPGDGVQTIQTTKELPALTDATGPTMIDGYTQPGASPNTEPLVSNAVIKVQIRGGGHDQYNGLTFLSPGHLVRGLALYNFNKTIRLWGIDARDNRVVGNFIGTDAAGTYGAPTHVFLANGVHIAGGATNNFIGGTSAAERNVISGNANHGVGLYNRGTDANTIVGNLIGLRPSGNGSLPNKAHGVDINTGASNNAVGGTLPSERNVISGNVREGVEISHGSDTVGYPTGNRVAGNFIGTDVTGERAPNFSSNGNHGVHIEDGVRDSVVHNNVIGNNKGPGIGMGVRAFGTRIYDNQIGITRDGVAVPNGVAGIRVLSAKRSLIGPNNVIVNNPVGILLDYNETDYNTITRNSIYGNAQLGIDIQPTGKVNINDPDDADAGANQQLNYPVLEAATLTAVHGTACAGCTVEVFAADNDVSMHGEGKNFAGSAVAGADGRFAVSAVGVATGDSVTATATDTEGNTSEFSRNLTVTDDTAPVITLATPPDGATYVLNEDVRADYSCADEPGGSGLKSCSGSQGGQLVAAGEPIDTSTSGAKTFTVTAEDNAGNVTSVTHNYTVAEPITKTYATDRFDRSVKDGWSSADKGGAYTLLGPAADFDVNGSAGTIVSPSASSARSAWLKGISEQDVDGVFQVSTNKPATGFGQRVYFIARHVSQGNEYRARLRFTSSGSVMMHATRLVAGQQTALSSPITVPGLTHAADKKFWLRTQVVGTNPTVIRMKVWEDGQAEPSEWQYSVTDAEAALQTAGGVGLRTYLSADETNAPTISTFDNFLVQDASTP